MEANLCRRELVVFRLVELRQFLSELLFGLRGIASSLGRKYLRRRRSTATVNTTSNEVNRLRTVSAPAVVTVSATSSLNNLNQDDRPIYVVAVADAIWSSFLTIPSGRRCSSISPAVIDGTAVPES